MKISIPERRDINGGLLTVYCTHTYFWPFSALWILFFFSCPLNFDPSFSFFSYSESIFFLHHSFFFFSLSPFWPWWDVLSDDVEVDDDDDDVTRMALMHIIFQIYYFRISPSLLSPMRHRRHGFSVGHWPLLSTELWLSVNRGVAWACLLCGVRCPGQADRGRVYDWPAGSAARGAGEQEWTHNKTRIQNECCGVVLITYHLLVWSYSWSNIWSFRTIRLRTASALRFRISEVRTLSFGLVFLSRIRGREQIIVVIAGTPAHANIFLYPKSVILARLFRASRCLQYAVPFVLLDLTLFQLEFRTPFVSFWSLARMGGQMWSSVFLFPSLNL